MSNIENSVITLKNFIEIFNERKTKGDIATIDVLGEEIYALENVLAEREQDKKIIKELEEENKRKDMFVEMAKEVIENSILKQKIKDLLTEIQEEYNKVQEQFDCIWNKKSKDDYDRYKLQEFSTMQQQLGFFIGKLEELLEEK